MHEQSDDADPVTAHVEAAAPGLAALLAEAQQVWDARAARSGAAITRPGWRPFEDAFPTFYQFTNRPR
jgi:hypothetical protein